MTVSEIQDLAEKYFNERYNCAQAVSMAFREAGLFPEGFDEAEFAGFGGGLAALGHSCGAILGLTAVVSYHKTNRNEPTNRQGVYAVLRKVYAEFQKTQPSLQCRDITGLDLTTPEGQAKYRESVHFSTCVPVVRQAVGLAYQAITD